jgi:tRNA (adenine37-N6)-methyltransferase
MKEIIVFSCIGRIHTPHVSREGAPIQPSGARGVVGRVQIENEFVEGIRDLAGFSHLILLYHFHLSKGFDLSVKPFLDRSSHGLFSTRAPRRPNAIGLSVVRLVSMDGNTLVVEDVDMVDGTPLLDIKPFVPDFDVPDIDVRTGWLKSNSTRARGLRADERFL